MRNILIGISLVLYSCSTPDLKTRINTNTQLSEEDKNEINNYIFANPQNNCIVDISNYPYKIYQIYYIKGEKYYKPSKEDVLYKFEDIKK